MGRRSSNSRGLTLVELLVVLVILVLVTAAAVPMMAPAIESRRLREATRGVSTYIMSARSRAIQIDRPVGIWIERLPGEPGASLVLFQAEVPPPFSGLTSNSTALVGPADLYDPLSPPSVIISEGGGSGAKAIPQIIDGRIVNYIITDPGTGYTSPPNVTITADGNNEFALAGAYIDAVLGIVTRVAPVLPVNIPLVPPGFGIPGDRIQFNHQGPIYLLVDYNPKKPGFVYAQFDYRGGVYPWRASVPTRVPYQIFRQPARSSAAPYQLPEGIVIDLEASGLGTDASNNDLIIGGVGVKPVIIMFAPSGALDRLYHEELGGVTIHRFSAPVHLLIGRRERLPAVPYDPNDTAETQIEKHNWKDLESRWVSIGQQTGAVAASENAFVLDDLPEPDFSGDIDDRTRQGIARARRFAAEMRGTGGR